MHERKTRISEKRAEPYRKRQQKMHEAGEAEDFDELVEHHISPKVKKSIIGVAALLFVVFSAVIYLNEAFWHNESIPSWQQIYESAGLSESVDGSLPSNGAAVHFIDVGQGDCELITDGKTSVLIDSGEYTAGSTVVSYLNSLEIDRLDYVVMSHPHSDHMGSMYYVLDKFDVGTVIMADMKESIIPATSSFKKLIDVIERKNIDVMYAEAGENIEICGGRLEMIAPVKEYDDLNNYSVVVRFVHGDNSFIFCGDICKDAERDILDSGAELTADVIKVAHHGSTSSSLKVFMQAVSPYYAVIEVGEGNDYGHPHAETVSLLKKLEIEIYRTDKNGNVVFVSDGKELSISTEKE
ncbi:MAG: ComEC/Rec2 family competence protein [Ruminiclostridium sp.]